MERKLKESEQWLDSTIKSLGEAVISTDKDGFIKTMNPFAEAMTGWKSNEALSKPISKVFNIISEKPDEKVENPVTKVIREGMFYGLAEHTVLVAKEGMRVPVDIIGTLIKNDLGNIIGTVMIFEDIIERKRMEERLNYENRKMKNK
jgi:PAS domain S-box-containing protein